MKNIFLIFLISSVFVNCSNDNINSIDNEILINSYYYGYMQYPQGILPNPEAENLVKIEYNNQNEISKRVGGLISVNPVTGFDYTFLDEIFDSITRNTNNIIIDRKTLSTDYEIPQFKRTIFLNSENKITQKIIETTFSSASKDTIDYQYNSLGKLTNTKYRNQLNPKESFYYYNIDQNLDSIVTKEFNGAVLFKKTIETFRDYDNSQNPTKHLIIFEETFYRSLTQNNYSNYERKVYNANGDLTDQEERNWNFIYDENGIIQFNVF